MKNKILSILLIFSIILPNNSTLAMENPSMQKENFHGHSPAISAVKTARPYQTGFYALTALCLSLITGASGYLLGYKKGNKNKLDQFKEIVLDGSVFLQGDVPDGIIKPILLARSYIKDVLKNEIPCLSQTDKFPAHKLSAIEYYLDLSDNISKNKTLNSEIAALARRIGGITCAHNRKIKLGTLKDLVKDAADLFEQAYNEVYVKKDEKANEENTKKEL